MSLRLQIRRFVLRLSLIFIAAGILLAVPEPETDSILRFKNVIVVFVVVILIGKLLLDTFFFDRYS